MSQSDFMRFLIAWQHVDPSTQLTGIDGVRAIIEQLDGFELAADAWDRRILPARVKDYDPSMLDLLCYSGETAWARLSKLPAVNPSALLPPRPVRATPIALFRRDHVHAWRALAGHTESAKSADPFVSDTGRGVLRVLTESGARFVHEIAAALDADLGLIRDTLAELVWAGLVASDGFAGLRAIWSDTAELPSRLFRGRSAATLASPGGRWASLNEAGSGECGVGSVDREAAVEAYAHALLGRYGIMCRRLMAREPYAVPWRELLPVYRRLEARGEVRGGRFVAGLPGEQFALAEAVELARRIRRTKPDGQPVIISAADPLNLCGIITPGDKVPAIASTQITFTAGNPVTTREADGSQLTVAS